MAAADFKSKIKTREELLAVIGPRPRKKKIIMCHGAFDVVHPGHLRHLIYAKEKADYLLASVTADQFITKGTYRPYVPQDLRAANLAALEIVDFVLIDENPTPLETIRKVQPDYFAKGYEYMDGGIHPKTMEEMQALDSYGGEMVFTPGDIVYSSSALLHLKAPNLTIEKLVALMESENIDFEKLRNTMRQMEGVPVHVLGDTIVDGYSYCSLLGASPKHPTFSVHYERTDKFAGAAAIVSRHVKAAGGNVTFSTLVGDDEHGKFTVREMEDNGVRCLPIVDPTRPTTYKERFITDGHRLLQVDRMDNRTISEKALKTLCENLRTVDAAVVLFSDFRHGIFNRHTIPALSAEIPKNALKAADSQVSNRWGNILDFTDFDLITPNEREARFALGDQDSVIRPLALELYRRSRCKNLMLKMGDRGLITYRSLGPNPRQFFTLDTFVTKLVDPVGAGDALLAYASLALAVSQNIVVASILGAMAAAAACEREGNVPVTPADVEQTIAQVEKRVNYAS